MSELQGAYQDALRQIDSFNFLLNDVLGGALFVICCYLILRFVGRALISSWIGNKNGMLLSSLIEAGVSVLFLVKAVHNPGVILVVLAWGAAIFRNLVMGFKF